MKVLHEQSQPDQQKMGYLNIEGSEPSKSGQNFDTFSSHIHQQSPVSEVSLNSSTMTRAKILKIVGIFFIVLAFGIVWKQDFQTSSQGPVNKPWLDEVKILEHPVEKQPAQQQKQFVEDSKKNHQEQLIRWSCYRFDELHWYVFFSDFDKATMTIQQVKKFESQNNVCHFEVLYQKAFDYFVDLWNQRQGEWRYDQEYINKTSLTNQEKRLLLIFFKLYFHGGIYVYPSVGVNFGKYISDRLLFSAQLGKQLMFAEVDHQNDKGIFVPKKNFKTLKVGARLSEWVRKIIKKIIAKQDWIEICQNYQCLIIKDAIKFPEGI